MTQPLHEEVRRWLHHAQVDLLAAERLIEGEALASAAAFHCQQAAEKSLKALLTLHEIGFEKTHDVEWLIELLLPAVPGVSRWETIADRLTEYAVEARYPSDRPDPSTAEVRQALELCQEFSTGLSGKHQPSAARVVDWLTGTLVALLVTVPLLAFVPPFILFDDCECAISDVQAQRLKVELTHAFTVPPLRYQLTEAWAPNDDPYAAGGTVVLRGPFGVNVGSATLSEGEGSYQRSTGREATAWAIALLVPASLVGALGWRAYRD